MTSWQGQHLRSQQQSAATQKPTKMPTKEAQAILQVACCRTNTAFSPKATGIHREFPIMGNGEGEGGGADEATNSAYHQKTIADKFCVANTSITRGLNVCSPHDSQPFCSFIGRTTNKTIKNCHKYGTTPKFTTPPQSFFYHE